MNRTTRAYVLPSANLVTRGVLDVHQLGSQYGFDRFWLFNSPVMVLGPVPLFALLGVGRLQALAGVAALAVANLLVIAWLRRPVWTDPAQHPLFSRAAITWWEFKGQPVIVARRVD